jgi:ribosomal-protein-alanine N-acetyltransferase
MTDIAVPAGCRVRPAVPADLATIASIDAAVSGEAKRDYPHFVLRQLFEVFHDQCIVVTAVIDGCSQIRGYALIGTGAESQKVLLTYAIASDDPALAAALHRAAEECCDAPLPVSPEAKAYKRLSDAVEPGTGLLSARAESGNLVRMAEDADLARLEVVDRAVFCELTYPHFVLCQLFDLFRPYCVVAQSDGEVCGYALIGVTPDHGTAWLLGLGVVPGHRGKKGLGARLLDAAMDLCREAGVGDVKITVRPTNEEAYRIYKRSEFVETAFGEEYFGEGEPRRLLHFALSNPDTPSPSAEGEEDRERNAARVTVSDE